MRAKFILHRVEVNSYDNSRRIHLRAVTEKPFSPDGVSEDNEFARWTPSGDLTMHVANPNLYSRLTEGAKFYLDFVPAD